MAIVVLVFWSFDFICYRCSCSILRRLGKRNRIRVRGSYQVFCCIVPQCTDENAEWRPVVTVVVLMQAGFGGRFGSTDPNPETPSFRHLCGKLNC